ncbi:MAG: protein kinase [Planctomycetota bacterium]
MNNAEDEPTWQRDDPSDSNSSPDASSSKLPRWLGKRIGRFRVISVLGKGAWGQVFEAEDTQLRRRVALKCININSKQRGIVPLERLLTEARAAAAIEHPNVTQIYEVGETKGIFYIAMELAEGGSTHALVKTAGPMDVVRACTLCAEAADALQLGHDCGIVHRDIKPANLLLGRNGRCKVADFGLAHGGDVSDPLHASKQGGTPFYIAPEIVRGSEGDARADIYSLAATLVYLLTGRHIVEGETRAAVLKAQVDQPPLDVRGVRPEIDPGLADVIAKALSKDPGTRFQTAGEFATALRVYTVPVNKAGTAIGGVDWKKVGPIAVGIGALVVLLLVILPFIGGDGEATEDTNARSSDSAADRTPTNDAVAQTTRHTFTLDVSAWANKPDTVHVAGDFNGWDESATPLTDPNGDDTWSVVVPLEPGMHMYKFVVNGDRWINDPDADPSLDAGDGHGGINNGVLIGP